MWNPLSKEIFIAVVIRTSVGVVEVASLLIVEAIHDKREGGVLSVVSPGNHAQLVVVVVASHDCRSTIFVHNIHRLHLWFRYVDHFRSEDKSSLEVFEGVEVLVPEVGGCVQLIDNLLEGVRVGNKFEQTLDRQV